jgi:hypothetical protein
MAPYPVWIGVGCIAETALIGADCGGLVKCRPGATSGKLLDSLLKWKVVTDTDDLFWPFPVALMTTSTWRNRSLFF